MKMVESNVLRQVPPRPEALQALLQEGGWVRDGGRQGLYARWRPANATELDPWTVVVPLDPYRADYGLLWLQALETLSNLPPSVNDSASLLARLLLPSKDEVRFRKDLDTEYGSVPWSVGEDLIGSARRILVASAKARIQKEAYFGNAAGNFARRFLDATHMGQTEVGSYVVTALTPASGQFPEKETTASIVPGMPPIPVWSGRDITETMGTALEAAEVAVKEVIRRADEDLHVFAEAVSQGVSRELVSALAELSRHGDGGEVTVELYSNSQTQSQTQQKQPRQIYTYTKQSAPVFEKAALHLSTLNPPRDVTVVGRVKVVARPERGKPGVVSLQVLDGTDARTLRVRLSDEQFEIAARAIAEKQGITVTGRQETEGRRHFLYHPSRVQIVELSVISGHLEFNIGKSQQFALFETEDSDWSTTEGA